MDVYVDPQYRICVNRAELRLIGLALSGRLWEAGPNGPTPDRQADRADAQRLNQTLARNTLLRTNEQLTHWKRVIEQMESAHEEAATGT